MQYIEQKFGQSYTPSEKVLYLAALGTLGSQKAISILKPIVQGESKYPLHVRQEAVWTLYGMAHQYPQEIISVMSPVLFNKTEDHEIRIAAFTVLIATEPSLYHFYDIIKIMKHEDNLHVQNYIYTTLQYLSNSTHPCHLKVGGNAKIVFEVLKTSNFTAVYSPSYSFSYLTSGYNRKYRRFLIFSSRYHKAMSVYTRRKCQ